MFKILIAEDDRELRQLFAHVLTKNGYTVLGVSNGEEALAALEQSYYDLIISDIMMPKMDGYELVRSVRESGSSIPIMMITAKDAFDDMRLGFLSGSDDYMVKPINIGEMVLRVSALLRRAQMASERRQVIGGTVMECDSLSVTVGGENAWYMMGHVFWSEPFSRKFVEILEREYDTPEIRDKLWEAVYAAHLDELKLRIRKYDPDFIFEFDSLDELRAFDPSYCGNTRSAIIKQLAAELGCSEADLNNFTALKAAVGTEAVGFTFRRGAELYRYLYAENKLEKDETKHAKRNCRN